MIAKEVGWGISASTAQRLVNVGVSAIDVAGAGGTSWSQVEMYRAETKAQARLAAAFINWGIPTADSIQMVKSSVPNTPIIASGGIKSGIDIGKALALGAVMGGMAGTFLKAANQSTEAVSLTIDELIREIKVCMFGAGVGNISELQNTPLHKRTE
ncbi:MAG: alpha-hydroxy-acid oxidizing protein [Anaerolineales bacterium]